MTEIPEGQPPLVDSSQPIAPAQTSTPPATTSTEPATPPPSPAGVPPVPPYAPPVAPYAPAMYPPPKKGTSALKIVLIVVGILIGLGIIAVGFVGFAAYKIAKSANMTTSSQPATAADLGVPPYPGAARGRSVRMTLMGNDMVTATFLTSDPKDQVIAFYRSTLGPGAVDVTSFNGESLKLDKGAGESITVTASDQPGGMGDRTQIIVLHMSKSAASSQ